MDFFFFFHNRTSPGANGVKRGEEWGFTSTSEGSSDRLELHYGVCAIAFRFFGTALKEADKKEILVAALQRLITAPVTNSNP